MSVPIKALAVIGAVSLIPAGVLIAKNVSTRDLSFESLSNENNKDYEGKYASSFKHHFMNATNSNKRGWWEESYKRLEKERNNLSDAFKKATTGYGTEATALNQICLTAYKSDKSTLETKYRGDIWRYCSVEQKEPIVNTSVTGTTALKIKKDYGDILIDTESEENNDFWNKQQEVFFGGSELAKNISQSSMLYSYVGQTQMKVKEICKKSYSWSENEHDTKEIIKFCSIQG